MPFSTNPLVPSSEDSSITAGTTAVAAALSALTTIAAASTPAPRHSAGRGRRNARRTPRLRGTSDVARRSAIRNACWSSHFPISPAHHCALSCALAPRRNCSGLTDRPRGGVCAAHMLCPHASGLNASSSYAPLLLDANVLQHAACDIFHLLRTRARDRSAVPASCAPLLRNSADLTIWAMLLQRLAAYCSSRSAFSVRARRDPGNSVRRSGYSETRILVSRSDAKLRAIGEAVAKIAQTLCGSGSHRCDHDRWCRGMRSCPNSRTFQRDRSRRAKVRLKPKLPPSDEKSNPGVVVEPRFVTNCNTPDIASEPYNALCGPLTNSTRSALSVVRSERSNAPPASLMGIPSMKTWCSRTHLHAQRVKSRRRDVLTALLKLRGSREGNRGHAIVCSLQITRRSDEEAAQGLR